MLERFDTILPNHKYSLVGQAKAISFEQDFVLTISVGQDLV
jgi:hypothetical protein